MGLSKKEKRKQKRELKRRAKQEAQEQFFRDMERGFLD